MGFILYVISGHFPDLLVLKVVHTELCYPLNTCKQELQNISKHYRSWAGRMVAFKMVRFPKRMYLFRALQIKIPPSFLRKF